MWSMVDAEDAVEEVSDVDASLRHHRRQLLPQLEFLPDDHHPTEILQGRFSLRYRQGRSQNYKETNLTDNLATNTKTT